MKKLSYKQSGVDIDTANDTKRQMAQYLESNNARVLNKIGAFATLFDGTFAEYKHPVLVFKTEEPGTKQKLALEHDSVETICQDLVSHLINDAIVMGAKPLSVQDCIVCGKMEKDVILRMVSAMSLACKENGCVLTGGETSEQPGVVAAGTYILTASIVGVVDKESIIDGSRIQSGDTVLALASSGIHTNGFSLVRKIMEASPEIMGETIDGRSFIETILTPHRCYYNSLKDLFSKKELTGLAHITGGGIQENLNRILPDGLSAQIDVSRIQILPIFKTLKKFGGLEDADMLRTFNIGVGITAVVKESFADAAIAHLKKFDVDAYPIGVIKEGNKSVDFRGELQWK
ncbi:MAG: phosphoribosylformylglycinamidine cyclo-ligase [bacterium]|nr:phosphoribosylformylglycinamidine cyclo-ligase [bacterium]